jgi:hypothetical protein
VHKSIDAGIGGLPELPAYVRRPHDEQLRTVIDSAGRGCTVVVLVGDPSTGKTRALWEAIQRLPQQWALWSPVDARALNHGLADGAVGPHTVVWLDDAHGYLDPDHSVLAGDNAARLRQLIGDTGTGPVLIAATLWRQNWQRLSAQPIGSHLSAGPGNIGRGQGQVPALLAVATLVTVPDSFQSTGDTAALREAADHDPRLAQAIRLASSGKITQYLAGTPALLERYHTAPVAIKAVIDAAIDARRLGHGIRLPEPLLAAAAPGYLDDDAWHQQGWTAEALEGASEDWRGLAGPLTPIRPRPEEPTPEHREYRLAPALEQVGAGARCCAAPPEEFWTAIARHGHSADLSTLANAAWARCRYRHATTLYRKAADTEDPYAMSALAVILDDAGSREEAEHLAVKAAKAGNDPAKASNPDALAYLVHKRAQEGDQETEDRLAGEFLPARGIGFEVLAKDLEARGDREGADQRVVKAAELGHRLAPREMVLGREYAGDHEGADRLAVKTAQAGFLDLIADLVLLREQEGNREGAERLAAKLTAAGYPLLQGALAVLRDEAGDCQTAERMAAEVAEAGFPHALRDLVHRREEAGDRAGAERVYRLATEVSHPSALGVLAIAREQAGNLEEAEQLASAAAEAGYAVGLRDLAAIRADAGNLADAERLALMALNAADTRALSELADIRQQSGGIAEAERLLRYGVDADGATASGPAATAQPSWNPPSPPAQR